MKLPAFFALFLISQISLAQLKVTKLSKTDLPAGIKFPGHVTEAFKYTDSDGEHLVFTAETGVVKAKDAAAIDGTREGELHAYNYKMDGGRPVLAWQVRDFIKDCGEDVTVNFLPGTFAVTDLNNDGKAEVWVMYRTACHGDVSAPNMKIIMYEGGKKYAVRGTAKVLVGNNPLQYDGGSYTFDEAFKNGDAAFKKYAEELWKKNLMETFK